jgi:eukaryotic-like serine/threonine-protein kinase
MNPFIEKLKDLVPSRADHPDIKYFKIIVYSLIGIILLTFIAGGTTFLVSLQGTEETIVPQVKDLELAEALIELQQKQLHPSIQLRYSSDPTMKGKVLSQNPAAGTVVKAGKPITLVISQGAVVDEVDNYIGRHIDDVRVELQTLFTTFDALLQIDEILYVFDDAPPGTIIQQDPVPGAELTGMTSLDLVVSRGPDLEQFSVPSYLGMDYDTALRLLVESNTPFRFTVTEPEPDQPSGAVVSQTPGAGEMVSPGTRIQLEITPPHSVPDGMVFGVFDRLLPNYAVPVTLRLDILDPDGERSTLWEMEHPGGAVSVPYLLEENTTLILSRFDTEIITHLVRSGETD